MYYLGHLKEKLKNNKTLFQSPSKHLKNILVDINNNSKVNEPEYVRQKTRSTNLAYSDSENSDVTSGNLTSDNEINISDQTDTQKKKLFTKKAVTKIQSDDTQVTKNNNKKEMDYNNGSHEENKRLISDVFLKAFDSHIPHWGGKFKYNGKILTATNTCTIDYYLFAFWVLKQIIPTLIEKMAPGELTNNIKEIVNHIDNNDWDQAKLTWLLKVMKKDISKYKRSVVSFFGEVENFFLKYVIGYQNHSLIQNCSNNCAFNGNTIITENSEIIRLGRQKNNKNNIGLVSSYIDKCSVCQTRVTSDVKFSIQPIFIFIETSSLIKLPQTPITVEIDFHKYRLLCVILHLLKKKHFISVFNFDNNYYLVDDLNPKESVVLYESNKNQKKYFEMNISSALYYRID